MNEEVLVNLNVLLASVVKKIKKLNLTTYCQFSVARFDHLSKHRTVSLSGLKLN